MPVCGSAQTQRVRRTCASLSRAGRHLMALAYALQVACEAQDRIEQRTASRIACLNSSSLSASVNGPGTPVCSCREVAFGSLPSTRNIQLVRTDYTG